ncbi:hypothetical protein BDV97DRAFT_401231 [Delphinella strobiligena]|nr:hypothetical protein BDV97DRAFT_401231 [Delphinella strobiligena]
MAVYQKRQVSLMAFEAAWLSAMQSRPSSTVCDDDSSDLSDGSDFSIISDAGSIEVADNEEDFVTVSPLVSPSVQTNEPTSLSKSVCVEVEEKIKTEIKAPAFHDELRQRTPRTMHPLATSDLLLRPKVDATTCESPSHSTRAAPIPIAQCQDIMTCSAGTGFSMNSDTLAQPSHPENVTQYFGYGATRPCFHNTPSHGVRKIDQLQQSSSRHSDHLGNEAHANHSLAEVDENAGRTLDDGIPSFNARPPGFLPAVTDMNASAVTQSEVVISNFADYIRNDLKSRSNTNLRLSDTHESHRLAHDSTIKHCGARLLAKDVEIAQLASKNREHVVKIEQMDAFLIEKEGDHIWQLDRITERMGETETVAKLEIAKLTERLRKAKVEHDQMTKRLEKAEASVIEVTGTLNDTKTSLDGATALVGLTDKNLVGMNFQLKNAETKLSTIELAHHAEKFQMHIKHADDLTQLSERSERRENELKKALTNAEDELEHKTARLATVESTYKANIAVGLKGFEDRIAELHAASNQVRREMKSKTSELNGAKLNIEDLERINRDLSHRLRTFTKHPWKPVEDLYRHSEGALGSPQ